jgi:glycosyltransferase involved in cell wall biosynthesis
MPAKSSPPASGIAVIIPFYNGSAFLERAIDSVRAQTLPADELIVVNDGSRAEETKWLHDFCQAQGIVFLDRENGGQGAARNAGVAATKAPYICFLDQDDFYLEHHNATLRAAVPDDDPRFGWVYADLMQGNEEGQIYKTKIIRDYSTHHPKTSLMKMVAEDLLILPSASLISRKAFEAVGGFDPQFRGYEDDDLYLRLFRAGYSNDFIDRAVTVWCVNDKSTSYSIHMTRSRIAYMLKLAQTLPDVPTLNYMFMRDAIVPRFATSILRDLRRIHKPTHPFYPFRDELYATVERCVAAMLGNRAVKGRQRRKIKRQWFRVKTRRYGVIRALFGAG